MEVEQLARTSKDFETKKRLLKKKMNIAESARLELPGFKATINDMGVCLILALSLSPSPSSPISF